MLKLAHDYILQGALLVFTLSKETSFIGLNYWLEEIKNVRPTKSKNTVCLKNCLMERSPFEHLKRTHCGTWPLSLKSVRVLEVDLHEEGPTVTFKLSCVQILSLFNNECRFNTVIRKY